MTTPQGRWKWLIEVAKDLGARAIQEPPYQPELLVHCTPEEIQNRCQDKRNNDAKQLLRVWQKWQMDTGEIHHQNYMNLRTLLRCYGIAKESLQLAKEDKKYKAQDMLDLLTAYLNEVWDMTEAQIEEAQANVDTAARRKASIITAGYMNKEWLKPTYKVTE